MSITPVDVGLRNVLANLELYLDKDNDVFVLKIHLRRKSMTKLLDLACKHMHSTVRFELSPEARKLYETYGSGKAKHEGLNHTYVFSNSISADLVFRAFADELSSFNSEGESDD